MNKISDACDVQSGDSLYSHLSYLSLLGAVMWVVECDFL